MTEQAPDDPKLFQLFNEIGIIEQLARNQFERVMPASLRLSQFSVLNHFVRLGGPRSPLELARAFQVTKGAMTNTLQKLEAKGLVEITDDPRDGRAKRVDITPRGREVRNEAIAALAPALARLDGLFGTAELDELLRRLQTLRSFLDANRDLA